MSKHGGPSDPFAGSVQADEKSPIDKLMDRLYACSDDTERAIAQVRIGDHVVEGQVNALDRSGANMVSVGFMVSKSISVRWRGRKIQTKVERDPRHSRLFGDVFDVIDEGDGLKISFFRVGGDRCPANGDLIDPTDPDDVD